MSNDRINLTARIDRKLHKKLRMELLKNDITYQDWVVKKIKEYVRED